MTGPLSNTGAVLGTAVSTTPTTTKASAWGAAGTLGGVILTGLGFIPGLQHGLAEVAVIVGGSGAGGSIIAVIYTHIRAAVAEIDHAIAGIEKGVGLDPATATGPAFQQAVADEVRSQLGGMFRSAP